MFGIIALMYVYYVTCIIRVILVKTATAGYFMWSLFLFPSVTVHFTAWSVICSEYMGWLPTQAFILSNVAAHPRRAGLSAIILDQELISYRYSSCWRCCSFCCSCWGDSLQKSLRLRRFKSDWDVGLIVLK